LGEHLASQSEVPIRKLLALLLEKEEESDVKTEEKT